MGQHFSQSICKNNEGLSVFLWHILAPTYYYFSFNLKLWAGIQDYVITFISFHRKCISKKRSNIIDSNTQYNSLILRWTPQESAEITVAVSSQKWDKNQME